jgi:hypothetical protein
VLKEARYVWIPRGTTLQVRVETDRGKPRVAEVLEVDASTACPGENAPILRKRLGHDNLAEHRTPNAPAEGAFCDKIETGSARR